MYSWIVEMVVLDTVFVYIKARDDVAGTQRLIDLIMYCWTVAVV